MSYWGNFPRENLTHGWTVVDKMRNLNSTLLKVSRMRSYLWRRKSSGTDCSCFGEHSQSHDRKCLSCYGTRYIGGYDRYGHTTFHLAAPDTTLTLSSGVERLDRLTPTRIGLKHGKIVGTIITSDVLITNDLGSVIEYDLQDYLKDPVRSNSVIEYAVDGGAYEDISELRNEILTNYNLRFRITLTRLETTVKTPLFEILRFRYQALRTPYIMISKNRPVFMDEKGIYAKLEKEEGITFWTQYFPTLNQEDMFEAIDSEIYAGERYVIFRPAYSEPLMDNVSMQAFKGRRDHEEIYNEIW